MSLDCYKHRKPWTSAKTLLFITYGHPALTRRVSGMCSDAVWCDYDQGRVHMHALRVKSEVMSHDAVRASTPASIVDFTNIKFFTISTFSYMVL